MPDISVLMPVYNGCSRGRESYLRMAIESILSQTCPEWEMVIVDDGSQDDTPRVLSEYAASDQRITIVRNESNEKIAKALNKGLRECSAPLVARQDADDYSSATRLETQKRFMDAWPNIATCGSSMLVVDEDGKLIRKVIHPCEWPIIKEALKNSCCFAHGSVMFRKDAVLALGGYSDNPDFEYAEDYELWARMAIAGHKLENVREPLYFHRNHPATSSNQNSRRQMRSTRLVMAKASSGIK